MKTQFIIGAFGIIFDEQKRVLLVHRRDYDLLPEAYKLTMPVLLITGDMDRGTPPDHQKMLFNELPSKKEFHIIKNAPHTFREPEHLAEIKTIFDKWIKDNLQSIN